MTMNILYFYFYLGPKILHKKFQVILSKIKGLRAVNVFIIEMVINITGRPGAPNFLYQWLGYYM